MYSSVIQTQADLTIAMHIRQLVFVEEQGTPLQDEFDEFDDYDALKDRVQHILVYYNEKPVGTGRLRTVDGFAKLERICILPAYRQFGLGKVIVYALEEIAKGLGYTRFKLHGQQQAEGFYHKLGYQTVSDLFMEDGIPHVLMVKALVAEGSGKDGVL
ncbi:Acetyltransferase (GNAT) domain-containing protein [Paenibacillus algorifonticola]|uniref:Acetyltransferase (GNAT) domain-containing protein n=1 Tax=Paenibacillus algorifonticola TaxID=684063 RepID=A0A1I2F7K1_9BACL|nr:Acetyltransferase (GNAT) domain-containing protein [Paenibacillus algorifonticola]